MQHHSPEIEHALMTCPPKQMREISQALYYLSTCIEYGNNTANVQRARDALRLSLRGLS